VDIRLASLAPNTPPAWGPSNENSRKRAPGPMTTRGDRLVCSRNPGSNYETGYNAPRGNRPQCRRRGNSLANVSSRCGSAAGRWGTMKALRLPTRASPVTYLVRFRGPRDSSSVRARRCPALPGRVEVPPRARIIVHPAIPNCRRTFTWTRVGPLRFPDDPSCASAPFQDPGRTDAPSPIAVASDAAPAVGKAKAPAC
jgi:hypothetical protein